MEVSINILLLLLLTSITAFVLKGMIGFGPSLIMIPILTILLDFRTAVVISTLADISSNAVILFRDKKKVNFKQMGFILAGLLVGTLIGVTLFKTLSVDILKRLFGVFIIAYVIKNIVFKGDGSLQPFNRFYAFVSGLLGGVFGGLFNVNGPPVVIYLKSVLESAKDMRSNLSFVFFVDAVWRGILFWQNGYMSTSIGSLFGFVVLPGLLLGVYLGEWAMKRMDDGNLRHLVHVVLIIVGSGLAIR